MAREDYREYPDPARFRAAWTSPTTSPDPERLRAAIERLQPRYPAPDVRPEGRAPVVDLKVGAVPGLAGQGGFLLE
jgi:hypothetical protein